MHHINRALFRLPVEPDEINSCRTGTFAVGSLACAVLTAGAGWPMGRHMHKLSTAVHVAAVLAGHALVRTGFSDVRMSLFDIESSLDSDNGHAPRHKLVAFGVRFVLCGMSFGAIGLTLTKFHKACRTQYAALALSVGDLVYWQLHSGRVTDRGRLTWM